MQEKNKQTVRAYDEKAQFYSEIFNTYNVNTDLFRRLRYFNTSGSNKILEIGSANGRDAKFLAEIFGFENYIGIDASKNLVEIAAQINPDLKFHVKDLNGLGHDYEKASLGVVFCSHTVLHVNRSDLFLLLEKLKGYLKKGGIIYVSSKYGEYREIVINNFGQDKYYYSYEPKDIEGYLGDGFETLYRVIGDSDYGPSFTLISRKK
jgi:SAM-dependent methyltransferase